MKAQTFAIAASAAFLLLAIQPGTAHHQTSATVTCDTIGLGEAVAVRLPLITALSPDGFWDTGGCIFDDQGRDCPAEVWRTEPSALLAYSTAELALCNAAANALGATEDRHIRSWATRVVVTPNVPTMLGTGQAYFVCTDLDGDHYCAEPGEDGQTVCAGQPTAPMNLAQAKHLVVFIEGVLNDVCPHTVPGDPLPHLAGEVAITFL
ncbi:MAG: hypothetical protein ACPGQL_05520 [Thermoplasmatota archaeon]